MRRRWFLVGLLTFGAPLAAGPTRRPAVDNEAMREAMQSSEPMGPNFPSAASYAHFLRARLAHHDGQHKDAVDELRLALASDDNNPFLMTQLAEQFARLSELDRAEAQLRRVIDKHPDYAPAQLLMGRVLVEGQKTARARAHLGRAIRLRPQEPDAYLVLTQLRLDQSRIDEAVKVVDELAAAIPGEPVGYRRLGLALAERGDDVRAEKLLQKAVERDAGDLESWLALARIAEKANRLDAAMDAYAHALERDPENTDALLAAGRLSLRTEGPTAARAYFDQLLSLGRDPEVVVKVAFSFLAVGQLKPAAEVLDGARVKLEEPRIHFYAGLVNERLRAWPKAADAFEAAVKNAPEQVAFEARMHRGMCLSMLGQHKTALELLRATVEARPDLPGAYAALGRALERAGQPREAELIVIRGFTSQGASSENVDAVTGFYERQGRLQDAVALFSGALAKSPGDEAVVFALANALEKRGDWQKAVEKVRPLLENNPANAAAANFVGYTLADRGGDLDEAEKLVKRALDSKPDSPAFLDSMGWVLFRRGEFPKAVQFLEKAVGEGGDDPTLLEHLADAYAMVDPQRARETYARALQVAREQGAADQSTQLERKLKLLSSERTRR